ncbi:hypothetical protein FHU38_001842 [Saccharomonospora amisosensis]|uniref:Uncharacterized protein n=1 Tax=Saccharomonospora amisosensis TaxID=1128677 RepID=A0A7X5ZQ69_9PSEU|nr:hypothetical protein [Saccharomonospora amisosensis]NIJ11498.1 hypothetical protein [Saccharomonospora amisosensis]
MLLLLAAGTPGVRDQLRQCPAVTRARWHGEVERPVLPYELLAEEMLAAHQPEAERETEEGRAVRTEVLALLRSTLLDLLATGDRERTTAAVRRRVRSLQGRG